MDFVTLEEISDNFLEELKLASSGHRTSLPFIANPIPSKFSLKTGEIFEVMVIGGSTFKKALIRKTASSFKILKMNEKRIELLSTKRKFLKLMSDNLYDDVDSVGINFAFGLKPIFRKNRLDGTLVITAKGHRFNGFMGKLVGKGVEDHVFKELGREIKVTVANDTICLLLSGIGKFEKRTLAAGVVGTGMNFAFFTDNKRAINVESGRFDKFNQTETGKKLDMISGKKNEYVFEQEVSGAYLYKHFNQAVKEESLKYAPVDNTLQLSGIASGKLGRVSEIAKRILERSAQFIACQIAGIVKFEDRDLTFVMEGSLFWNGYRYKETVEKTVVKLVSKYKVHFVRIKNSDIIGAAKLVC